MSPGATPRKLTLGDLDRFLGMEVEGGDDLARYLDAAAVLAAFHPLHLHPVGGGQGGVPDALLDRLLPRCEPVTQGPERGLWALLLGDRRAALKRLGSRPRMRQALDANQPVQTPVQAMFERVIHGEPVLLEELSREELAALFTVHDWVEGILGGLPDRTAIDQALARVDLLAPMRRLAGPWFVDRSRELHQLAQYAAAAEPPAPLFVYGSGGVGKSTMLARFLLDQVESNRLPIAYLDLDRPTIRPDKPLTLLLETVTQLRTQLDVAPQAVEGLVSQVSYAILRGDEDRHFESADPVSDSFLIDLFSGTFAPALADGQALLVVDTFEEAQFLGSDVVEPLIRFLLGLPHVRLILSGRTLPGEFLTQAFPWLLPPAQAQSPSAEDQAVLEAIPIPYRPINLEVLDQEPATDLLQASTRLAGLPPLSVEEVDDIIGIVSRNPMCLKLAVRLLQDEGVDKLRASRSEFLSRLKAEKIQALLYGRILRHLHSADASAVAYPGLVVRRITPEVIREVLAGPCGLRLTKDHDEHAIFQELAEEAALVQVDPEDGSLRHRADVRRVMLDDLADHVPGNVIELIDSNAVAFYQRHPDPIARAEEIYHRLRLRQPADVLDARWMPEAAARLGAAVGELPSRQRLWLAGKLQITLDPSVRRTARQEEWEDQTARSVERFLQSNAAQAALELLRERAERLPRSKLYLLEAETHRFLGQPNEALQVARAGVEAASGAGAVDLSLELLLQMVVIEEGRDNIEPAWELLEEASAVAAHTSNQVLRFRVTVTRLRLHRQLHPDASDARAALRREAIAEVTDEFLITLRGQPVLLREAAAELAKDDPRIAAAAVEALGIEVSTDAQAEALGKAIVTLNAESPAPLEPTFVEGAQRFQAPDADAQVVRSWATRAVSSKDTRNLGSTLASARARTPVLHDFRNYFRAGVNSSLRASTPGHGNRA
jgi:hypothetical protein